MAYAQLTHTHDASMGMSVGTGVGTAANSTRGIPCRYLPVRVIPQLWIRSDGSSPLHSWFLHRFHIFFPYSVGGLDRSTCAAFHRLRYRPSSVGNQTPMNVIFATPPYFRPSQT